MICNNSRVKFSPKSNLKGLDLKGIGVALKANGFEAVDLSRWDEMIAAIDAAVA